MKNPKNILILMALTGICLLLGVCVSSSSKGGKSMPEQNLTTIKLPEPAYKGKISIEETLLKRRSIRNYKNKPLTLAEISQLLWSAQGITKQKFLRAAPSAGALYPLEIYLVAGDVDKLPDGIYKYKPQTRELVKTADGDKRAELSRAALGQSFVKTAPATIVFCAVYGRITSKYGERGKRYVYMEIGHASENVYLQGVSLNIGTCAVGAFNDEAVKEVINPPEEEEPLYLMPVGKTD